MFCPTLVDSPLGGIPSEFLDETYAAKTREMVWGYCVVNIA